MKKIIAFVLGATVLTASALSLAGCGHKHNYAVSYQVADCNNEGYTMHTCTDCGYKYADEFIAPYGHAYRDYYHIEENIGSVKSVAYSLTAESDSHYSLFTTFSEKDLEYLQKAGKYLCVHEECEFCDFALQLPENKFIEFQQKVSYLSGADYKPVDYRQYGFTGFSVRAWVDPLQLRAGSCSIPSIEHNGAKTASVKYEATSSDYNEYVPKTTIYSNEFKIDEADFDKLHVLIPDCIETIEDSGFGICTKLERVCLSKNLKTIGKDVFKNSSIDSVLIPKNLKSIGSNAFANCDDLKVVYFCGTEEEWNAIQIESGNDSLINAPRYYYSEVPIADGNFWYYFDGEPVCW